LLLQVAVEAALVLTRQKKAVAAVALVVTELQRLRSLLVHPTQ
jgi:hypothetical protein